MEPSAHETGDPTRRIREILETSPVLSGDDVSILEDLARTLLTPRDLADLTALSAGTASADVSPILNSLPLGIWALDDSLHCTYISPFIARSLERVPDEIIGKTAEELDLSGSILDRFEKDATFVLTSGEMVHREAEHAAIGTTEFEEYTVYPVRDEQGSVSQAVIIIGRRKDHHELERVNANLSTITETIRIVNSSQYLYQMLDTIIRLAMERLGFDAGWIYLKGMTGSQVKLFAHKGVPDDFVRDHGDIEPRHYPHNIVFFAGVSRFVENTPSSQPGIADSRILESVDAISYAAVPLMSGSVVLGGLFLAKRTEGFIPPLDREVLKSIGREVGSTVLRGMLQERLEDSIEDTTAYLDLLSRDIRTKNDTIEKLAQSIRLMLDGPAVRLVDLQLAEIQQVRELIENVTTMRKLPEKEEDLVPVDLDEVVESVRDMFPSTKIEYDPIGMEVLADDFLPVIFSNLVGNSIKFGGPDVRIRISADKIDSFVEVSLEDEGPGMPDAAKTMLLVSSQDPMHTIPGKCMGLYLIHTLIRRYGGTLRIEDRVAGDSSRGLAVRFTLCSCG